MTPSDVKIVAENINDFIEVPDGINRLRKAVLTLAMSGQLLAQDEKEGTAQDLYNEILKTKNGLLTSGRRKRTREISPIAQEEVPFEVPQSWKWVRLVEVGEVVGGGTPSTTKSTYFVDPDTPNSIPWLTPADMRQQSGVFIKSGKKNITEEAYKNSSTTLMPKGSIIFSSRAPIGYVGIAENPLTTNQGFKSLVPYSGINSKFLYWFLTLRADDINLRATGTTFKEISGSAFANEVFVLVPSKEQERIVEKIEVVMKQLDELESQKNERDVIRTRLTRSAMQALGFADLKIAFDQLAELIKTSQDIKELENAILTLAVSGKLVPQEESEGTAEQLYAQIKDNQENQDGGSVRKKKQKDLPPITPEEIPFAIPESWKWVRVSELAKLITDGEHISPIKQSDGIPLATAKNVLEEGVFLDKVDYVSEIDANKFWKRCNPEKGDLLICSRGTIGRATVVNIDTPFCLMGSVILIKFSESTLSEYLKYYLRTEAGIAQIGLLRKGMAVGALYLKDIEKALVPLPPLAEQKRIVEKVEELMSLLERLKNTIRVS